MEAAGVRCDFVGHPVVTDPVATPEEVAAFRTSYDLNDVPLALILPGSRRSEVSRLLPIFSEVVADLHTRHPDLQFVLPAAPNVASAVGEAVQTWAVKPVILNPAQDGMVMKQAAFAAADVAVAASGTVSLELAASGTPMVIAYDMNWLSRQIIGRMLRVDTVTLVNLVSETRVIPEFIGANCQPEQIAKAVSTILEAPAQQQAAMALTMDRLGKGGLPPGERAALAVLDGLK